MKFVDTKSQRICFILTAVAAVLPIVIYLAALAFLPDMIPVRANSAGLLVIDAPKTSFEAIAYSFQSVLTAAVMYLATKLVDIFARRTKGSAEKCLSTHNGMLWITFGATLAMTVVWTWDLIKIFAQ